MDFITRAEAKNALSNGGQVLFHWHGNSVEVTLNTTLSDLRKAFWREGAAFKLTVTDVTSGQYSII